MDKEIYSDKALIEARGVTKLLHSDGVLKDITFIFNAGQSFGFLGPRWSGKSSLLKLLYCSATADKGEIFVLGLNTITHSLEIKSMIGIVPENESLENELTVIEQLMTFAAFYDLPKPVVRNRARDLLQQLELADVEGVTVRKLNPLQRKKLALARALINSPKLLILDEITRGLTSVEKEWMWQQLKLLKAAGISLVLSSSSAHECEIICDQVLLIHKGSIIGQGKPKSLISDIVGAHIIDFHCPLNEVEYQYNKLNKEYEAYVAKNRIRLFIKDGQDLQTPQAKISSEHLLIRKPNLDDVYFKLTGSSLESTWHKAFQ